MPIDPCLVQVNVLDAIHNGVTLGLTTMWRMMYQPTRAPTRAPGKTGEGCAPAVIRRFLASVKYLVGPPPAIDASGTLVLKGVDGTGATITATIVTMLEDGYEEMQDRDAPGQGGFTSAFRYKGDFDATPVTFS